MARYKLVRIEDSRLVTGEELRQQLLSEGFTVPAVVPLVTLQKPAQPAKPARGATIEEWRAYVTANHDYQFELANVNSTNEALRVAYFEQFTDFAGVLSDNFVIASGVYDRSTRTWNYLVYGSNPYTFQQAAEKLMGKYKPLGMEPIEFICNGYF